MNRVIVSLNDLKVVQDRHDVLRHEDVAGVNRHAGHRDKQGVWGGDVKEGGEILLQDDRKTQGQLRAAALNWI